MTILLLVAATLLAQTPPDQAEASLLMASPGKRVVLKVKDGALTSATVNGEAIPLDRVKREGTGLKVVDADGAVIGSMAKLPTDGPAALKPVAPPADKVRVFTDNPGLQVQIVNSRELVVTHEGKPVPAAQIKMENGELRIFNANGDLLRIIPADSTRLEKR